MDRWCPSFPEPERVVSRGISESTRHPVNPLMDCWFFHPDNFQSLAALLPNYQYKRLYSNPKPNKKPGVSHNHGKCIATDSTQSASPNQCQPGFGFMGNAIPGSCKFHRNLIKRISKKSLTPLISECMVLTDYASSDFRSTRINPCGLVFVLPHCQATSLFLGSKQIRFDTKRKSFIQLFLAQIPLPFSRSFLYPCSLMWLKQFVDGILTEALHSSSTE